MNNKTLFGINIALIIAVIALFIMHFTGGDSSTDVTDPDQEATSEVSDPVDPVDDSVSPVVSAEDTATFDLPEFNKGLKIAYVNADSVNARYKYYLDAQDQLEREYKRAEAKFAGKAKAFEKKYGDFMKEQQNGLITSQDELERRYAELQDEKYELDLKQAELSQGLQVKQADLQLKVIRETTEFLNQIGDELGYDYVIAYSEAVPTVYYTNKDLDITEYVISKLNEAYSAKQN